MPFFIINESITEVEVDAIVNSANQIPEYAGGVEALLYEKGGEDLFNERAQLGPIPFGEARLTLGYNLNSDYVIHTVAPIFNVTDDFITVLKSSYLSSLELATKKGLSSIAFPLLSSGLNGCKRDLAIETAIDAINMFLKDNDLNVYLVLYKPYRPKRLERVHSNLVYYLQQDEEIITYKNMHLNALEDMPISKKRSRLDKSIVIDNQFETFQEMLFDWIDSKEYTEPEVYKRANVSRKLFSKIQSDKFYTPKKTTVIALAFALKLDLDDALELLESAGFTLARGIEFDQIIRFFLEKEFYDVIDINIALHEYGYKPLGSK